MPELSSRWSDAVRGASELRRGERKEQRWEVSEVPFLHEIYCPKNQDHEVDLCFVHGLNPWHKPHHAYETWTHQNGTFWPYDFLPDDIPEARIFIYGYNSNIAKDVSEARIKDHANVLLSRLQRKRQIRAHRGRRQHGTTPIIFIGHSLGGLVIKQALLNARDDSTYEPIKSCTHGLVFFGTPHRGGNNAAFGQMAANIAKFLTGDRASNDLLECLRHNSLFTQEASERFSHQLEKYKMVSFFETLPMKLGMKGIADIVVDKDSAVLNLAGTREKREALNADHSSMCKIGTKGDMYEGVMGCIRDMVDDALDEQPVKSASLGSSYLDPQIGQTRARSVSPAPRSRKGNSNYQSEEIRDGYENSYPALTSWQEEPIGRGAIARVLLDFEPLDSGKLPLVKGEVITHVSSHYNALGRPSGWMRGVNSQGNVGLFPQTCVEIIRDTISSTEFTKPGIWDRPAGPIHSLSTPNPAYGGFSAHEYSVSLRPSYSEANLGQTYNGSRPHGEPELASLIEDASLDQVPSVKKPPENVTPQIIGGSSLWDNARPQFQSRVHFLQPSSHQQLILENVISQIPTNSSLKSASQGYPAENEEQDTSGSSRRYIVNPSKEGIMHHGQESKLDVRDEEQSKALMRTVNQNEPSEGTASKTPDQQTDDIKHRLLNTSARVLPAQTRSVEQSVDAVASQIIPQEYDKEKALQSEALLEGEKLPSTKDVQLSSSHAHEASEAEEEGELGATPPSPVKEAPSTLEQHSTALPKEDSSAEEGSSQNAPSEEAGAVTVPQPILVDILPCTNCKQKPPSYPVYACATCVGEPTICVSCSQSVFSDPKNIHKYHNVRLLASDAWYSMKDMYLPGSTEIAPADAVSQLGWGIQWQQHAITSQDFKLGTMPVTDGAVVFFSPRPSGTFRFLLRNVPAGQYEVKLQVGMWPSTFFGEAQVDELKTLKKLAVKSSMSPIGFIDAHAGCLVADAADRYMTLEPLDPNQVFPNNSHRKLVKYGTYQKFIVLPLVIAVTEGQHIGVFIQYMRNSDLLVKEKADVQNRLSFCWGLYGIRLSKRAVEG